MSSIRAFIAIPTDSFVQQRIALTMKELEEANAEVRWEKAEKLHITLKFLGSIDSDRLDQLSQMIAEGVRRFSKFEILFRGVGAFPTVDRPRIVWIGIESHTILSEIQREVEEISHAFGFAKEDREFHPHITIGRVKGTRNIHRLTEKLKSITFEPIRSLCAGVHIMQSTLHPTGSVYAVRKSFSLT
jgi:2'-5' RNA ligase